MGKTFEGNFQGSNLKIAIIAARFNEFFTSKLLSGAKDALARHGVNVDDIDIVWVPGSYEIPIAAQKVARTKKYDGIICLGAIIRGSTPHFDYVSAETAKGIAKVSLDESVPISFGVLTTDTLEQAIERSGTKAGNKGFEAAQGILEMVNLLKTIA